MENRVKVIQAEQISSLNINPRQCIEWAREAFLIKERTQMPPKQGVHPQGDDFITTMPCLIPMEQEGNAYYGVKIVSRIKGQQPTLQSTIMLYEATTGRLLAVIDGDWITAMRTGAVAALAASTLKRNDVNTYSMMGLGNIARAVAMCIISPTPAPYSPTPDPSPKERGEENLKSQNLNLKPQTSNLKPKTIRLLRYKDQAERFVERFKDAENVRFEIIDDKREFAAEADVLISCVTVANELLFPDDSLFREGVTVIPVHTRGFQNCDLFFDKVFGDDTGQIRSFKYFDRFRQYDELAQVLRGDNPGRTSEKERILSYNYGIALHDVYFASKIYEMTEGQENRLAPAENEFTLMREDKKIWL